MMTTDIVFSHMEQHKPIIIYYGKGYLSDEDIKDIAYYDEEIQKYRDSTGVWGNKLLRQIVRGEIKNTSVEIKID